MRYVLLVAISALYIKFLFAQDTIQIKPVEVFGNRLSLFDVNTNAQKTKFLSLNNFLVQSPFFDVKSYGNTGISTVSLLGLGASHTQVLFNNIPLNSPMSSEADISFLPFFFVDKIKVIPGVSSLNIADGAFGGSINVNVAFSDTNFFETGVASFHTIFDYLKYTTRIHNGIFLFKTGFFYTKNDFSYINETLPTRPKMVMNNSNFFSLPMLCAYKLKFSRNILKLFTLNFYTNRQIPPILTFSGLSRIENLKDIHSIFISDFFHRGRLFNYKIITALSLGYEHYFLGDSMFSAVNTRTFILRVNSFNKYANFYTRFKVRKRRLSVSFNLNGAYATTYDSIFNIGYLGRRYFLNTVINYEIGHRFFKSFLVKPILNDSLFLYPTILLRLGGEFWSINIGNNIKFPSLNDLYWNPGGNVNLKPEKNFYGDFSYSYTYKTFSVSFFTYMTVVYDWIIWHPTVFGYWTPDNLNKVFSRGLFLKAFYFNTLGKFKYSVNLNYALTLTQNYTPKNFSANAYKKQLIYIPKNKFSFSFLIQYKHFQTNLAGIYIGKRYTTSDNNERFALDPYLLINFYIFYQYKSFQVLIRVNNLLNKQYYNVPYRPMPRRNMLLTFSFRF